MVFDKSGDYRSKFSEEFKTLFPMVKSQMPKGGTCFDYFFDPNTGTFIEWDIKVPSYAPVQIGGGQVKPLSQGSALQRQIRSG